MMVRPGTVGPFRAVGEVVGGQSERLPVELTLHDEGNGDRAKCGPAPELLNPQTRFWQEIG